MQSNSIDRFKKRKKLKNSITVFNHDIEESEVNEFLEVNELLGCDHDKVNSVYKKTEEFYDVSVSHAEAEAFLIRFKKEFNQARFDQLVTDCKKDVINSIVTPFGIGHIIAAYDKTGGNVDTVHNARNGTYATENEQNSYENRGDYNSDEYHKDSNFISINKQHSQNRKDGNATDYMTGDKLDPNQSHDLDHIKSAKEIHDDAGRVLAEVDGSTLANTDTNLAPTKAGSNRTKKADSMEDFLAKKNERLKKIDDLRNKDSLSPQEQNELRKMEELSKIDDKLAMEADEKARKEIDKEINKTYYTSGKFAKNTAIAGAKEGAKMGMQQALGLVITEFFTAVFDEIIDIYKNGYSTNFEDNRFFSVLKERLKRIALRIKDKWKDAAMAFKDGFISGFISNLVTVVINAFVTTGKRVIRIIREGIYSLFKAAKVLIFPPENMTYEEALHEAKKLLATGLIVSLGVLVEQYIDTLIKGTAILEPFSDILTTVFVGAITGLAVTMTVYHIDKKKNDKDAVKLLMKQTDESFDNIDSMLNSFRSVN
jgi:hypothetical protein